MSADGILKLLIDTNVWMDYFSGRSDRTADVVRLFEIADVSEQIALFASSLSVKDVSYLVSAAIKRECRRKNGSLSDNAIAAADETAWACVRQMRELASSRRSVQTRSSTPLCSSIITMTLRMT